MASALDYAHRQGVIHRDIKPENVLLHDGSALVADFGIALAVQSAGGARMTQTGLSLGTPQYMSPEQAMGERTIDARSDIYALGAMTYEMLAGDAPFTGSSVQAIVAKVISSEPERLSVVRKTVPPHIEAAVLTALAKLPADRYASAAEFATALSTNSGATYAAASTAAASPAPRRRPWLVAVALLGPLAGALAGWVLRAPSTNTTAGPTFTALVPRPNERWHGDGATYAVSPNGRLVALVATRSAWGGITIRSLDSLGVRELPNTDGATTLFFSRDNRSLGFSLDGELRVIDLTSGSVRTLCPAPRMRGADWGADDVILYTPYDGQRLFRTSVAKNECVATTVHVPAERYLGMRPRFLADGRHFVLSTGRQSYLGEVGQDSLRFLTEHSRGAAVVAAGEWLLFDVSNAVGVFAQRIDANAGTLTGERVRLIDSTRYLGANAAIAASLSGTVVALLPAAQGSDSAVNIARVSMDGRILERLPAADHGLLVPALSPNGRMLATGGTEIGRYDITRRSWNRLLPFTAGTIAGNARMFWVGDSVIAFNQRGGADSVFQLNTNTGAQTVLFGYPAGREFGLSSRSRDGRYWLYALSPDSSARFAEAWVFDATDGSKRKLFDEGASVGDPQLSPDGRLVTYTVQSGARRGLFVRPFGSAGVPIAVVEGYVFFHVWSDDGRSIYFVRANRTIEVVDVNASGEAVGPPRVVVPTSTLEGISDVYRSVRFTLIPGTRELYVSLNGQRARSLMVLQNFAAFAARGR